MTKNRGAFLTLVLAIYTFLILLQIIRNFVSIFSSGISIEILAAIVVLIINITIVVGLWYWKKIAAYGLFMMFSLLLLLYIINVWIPKIFQIKSSSTSAEALAQRIDLIITLSTLIPVIMMLSVMSIFFISIKRKWQYFK
jgi:hypothetical protein